MGLLNLFKLEKLKVEAFAASTRQQGESLGTFEAMYNPESYSQTHKILYAKRVGGTVCGEHIDYLRKQPSQLAIKLVLDGTGVDSYGLVDLFGGQQSVADRLAKFYQLTYDENAKIHEPNYLTVTWGKATWAGQPGFDCRLGSVNVNYTNFDRDGTPLRAELDIVFLSDANVEDLLKKANPLSPDVTHRVVVKEGDTLPFLSRQVYGSPQHYLLVAAANGLDDFRDLPPGTELAFPPLPSSVAAPT